MKCHRVCASLTTLIHVIRLNTCTVVHRFCSCVHSSGTYEMTLCCQEALTCDRLQLQGFCSVWLDSGTTFCVGDIPRKQNLTSAPYSAINLSCHVFAAVCLQRLNDDNYSVPEWSTQRAFSTLRLKAILSFHVKIVFYVHW